MDPVVREGEARRSIFKGVDDKIYDREQKGGEYEGKFERFDNRSTRSLRYFREGG